MLQILELFGGIGSPRIALRNMGIPTKSIDYVEIDQKAVDSYNAIFANDLENRIQSVVNWNLKPDILIHGSPCQDISIAGHQKGADEGSETRSSLMWETLRIIKDMGTWRPRVVIWENVKAVTGKRMRKNFNRYLDEMEKLGYSNSFELIKDMGTWRPRVVIWENVKAVTGKRMRKNFNRYLDEMEKLGYSNSFELLDARDFGIPQARQRVFTISMLDQPQFNFRILKQTPMRDIREFLLNNDEVERVYDVTQPSVLSVIGKTGIKRATVIEDFAYTITTRQDRTPAQIIDCGAGRFRYLTELECWRLQGYSDEDYNAAASTVERNGRFRMPMYKQAGNSIPVDIFESIFEVLL